MFTTLMKSYRLWSVKRQISHIEKQEVEIKKTLRYLQNERLPALRVRRNNLMYGRPTKAQPSFLARVFSGK